MELVDVSDGTVFMKHGKKKNYRMDVILQATPFTERKGATAELSQGNTIIE